MTSEIVEARHRPQHEPDPAPTSALCLKCFYLLSEKNFVKELITNGYLTFYRAWEYILAETGKGCELCTMISSKIKFMKYGPLKSDRISDEVLAKNMKFELSDARIRRWDRGGGQNVKKFSGVETLRIEVCLGNEEGSLFDTKAWETVEEFKVSAKEGDPMAKYINRRPRIYDVASERSFEMAKDWLQTCCSSHQNCPPMKAVQLPTRVIDVGTSESTKQRLFTTKSIPGEYAALSYCWGSDPQPLIATLANVHNLHVDIPTASLALTIQEAILVTRKLGLRYIWIDAICIIQDSALDRDKELARMGEIYELATITIVAASAKNCKEGFLQRRQYPWGVQEWKSFKLPISCGEEGEMGELVIEPEDPYFTGDQPINHRGWTLQEFLLPGRKLVYSTTQLMWQCHSAEAELGNSVRKAEGVKKALIRVQILPILLSNHTQMRVILDAETLHDIRFNWQLIVANYTSRSLTNRNDTLPGISGIASKFSRFLREDYRAGLWYSESDPSNFVEDLLWSVRISGGGSLDQYTAPSWSWAGQTGTISWESRNLFPTKDDMVCSVEECVVELVGTAIFGEVNSGKLRLKAKVRKMEVMGEGDIGDEFKAMVGMLEEEGDVSIILDDTVEMIAWRFFPESLWCVLLTQNGGFLVVPFGEGDWIRIGIFYVNSVSSGGSLFNGWFEDGALEEISIL